MHYTIDDVKQHIFNEINHNQNLKAIPEIEIFSELSEVILIKNINSKLLEPVDNAKEIMVDVSCGAACLRGAHIYGPGVLAMQSNTKIDEIVNVFADIVGRCKRGMNTVYDSKQKLFIGVGRVKMQRFQLYGIDGCRKGIATEMIGTISTVPSIGDQYFLSGSALLQNLPSIVCGRVLAPQPNEIILDMCAAPGNKTTHLAQLMNDTGSIIALDKSERRVATLKENIDRFGIKCVQCFAFDAKKAISTTPEESGRLTPPFAKQTFDRILLDAPCSGFGNRPILASKMTTKMIESYPKLQKSLLDVAAQLLKVGGSLVYSTCTVFDAENELNVKWFLDKYGEQFELVAAVPKFGGSGLQNCGLSDDQRSKVQRFGPNFEQKTINSLFTDSTGFFICKFKRIS